MLSLILATNRLLKTFKLILKDEETKALLFFIFILLLSGTIFFSTIEKMNLINALYLSYTTLTTIGYGDVYPITQIGKIFTIVYSFLGIGTMAVFISIVTKTFLNEQKRKINK